VRFYKKKLYRSIGLHMKYWLFGYSCRILIKLEFSWKIFENFTKIRPVGAELSQVGGRTDRHDEVNSRFSQFCESA